MLFRSRMAGGEMEIERKFRLFSLPPKVSRNAADGTPGEVRVRRKGDSYFLTAKSEGSLARYGHIKASSSRLTNSTAG